MKLSLAFVERIRDNYFDPKSKKQLKELQIALFELLASVLAPLIEAKQGTKVSAHFDAAFSFRRPMSIDIQSKG